MFKKVLVPLDGSELAEGILPYISHLAEGAGASVTLLSVIDPDAIEAPRAAGVAPTGEPPAPGMDFVPPGVVGMDSSGSYAAPQTTTDPRPSTTHPHETGGRFTSQLFERVENEVEGSLRQVAKKLQDRGVKVATQVAFGKAAEEIVRVAESEGCDLIAMSTHGRTALGRGVLGSVTDRVIHSSRLPTLTITPDRAQAYWQDGVHPSRLMVPLDGSELAESALPYVEDLAKALSLEVMLVRVVKLTGVATPYSSTMVYTGSVDLQAEIEADATEYLKRVAAGLNRRGVSGSWKLLTGATARAIVDLARRTPQDLVVLTTHGRTGLKRWALGSVAEALVRGSGDPVMVIPSD
jgi:nucleotide-binding universal stress UspA family protein